MGVAAINYSTFGKCFEDEKLSAKNHHQFSATALKVDSPGLLLETEPLLQVHVVFFFFPFHLDH